VRRALLAALLLPALAGCEAVSDLTGAAAGLAAGTVTSNPVIGYGIGVATRAATQSAINWAQRVRQRGEQDAIAEVIGALPPDEPRPWRIAHTIPIGDSSGEARLVREIATPLATCREAIFSVEEDGADGPRQWFLTTACRQGGRWKWAAAEPAVARWGSLH